MKPSKPIHSRPAWITTAKKHLETACIVCKWELVTIELNGIESHYLYGTVISDYKQRWSRGDYVFSSEVIDFEKESGLVKTKNSLYCLEGEGEQVFATLLEAVKMKSIGQSMHVIRDIEKNIGEI